MPWSAPLTILASRNLFDFTDDEEDNDDKEDGLTDDSDTSLTEPEAFISLTGVIKHNYYSRRIFTCAYVA